MIASLFLDDTEIMPSIYVPTYCVRNRNFQNHLIINATHKQYSNQPTAYTYVHNLLTWHSMRNQ